ncbi:coiled-coil domain-containing protein 186-like isoform X2 [Gigantopelta aegis]|uniref:coiled-coil domain-containing protein 186-like isoform X2 n=1 Tax=Gigantopelta aegis TaxID=1735272 RepID=UPI001B88AF37|nr:coiled-coil domain-containing protein 186-like isoform X2 [Gigantopelta aegis]
MSEGDPENGDFSENPEPEADSEFVPDSNLTVEDERELNDAAVTDQPEDELCNLNGIPSNSVSSGGAECNQVVEEHGQNSRSDEPEDSDCNSNDSTPVHRPLLLSNHAQCDSPSVSNDSTPVHVPHSSGQLECSLSESDNEGTVEIGAGAEVATESECGGGGVSNQSDRRAVSDDAEAAPEDEVVDSESATSTAGSVVEDTPECDQGIGAKANHVHDSWRTTNVCLLSDIASDSSISAAPSCENSSSLQMATRSGILDACTSSSSDSLDLSNISVKDLLREEISDDDEEEMLNFKKNISDMVNTSFNTSHTGFGGDSSVTNNFAGVSEQLLQKSADVNCDSQHSLLVEQPSMCVEHVETQEVPDCSAVLDKSCDKMESSQISVKDNSKTSDPASEDDLLSELDAELQTHSINFNDITNSNDPSAILPSIVKHEQTEVQSSSYVLCPGMLPPQFQENSSPPNGLKVTDSDMLKSLQGQLNHMQKLLEESGTKFKKLFKQHTQQSEELDLMTQDRDRYHSQVQAMKSRNPDDLYIPQIKELEYMIAQQQNELHALKDRLSSHDASAKRAINTLQNEMRCRVEQITKMYEDCLQEKNSMVVKYAESEQKNIEMQKVVDKLENKLRDAARERESLVMKIKCSKLEKQKLVEDHESKCSELGAAYREIEKLRENFSSVDVRIKWAQNKLRAELEAHKETKASLETTTKRLKEAKEETQQIRRDCQRMIKTYQESEEIKSNSLDKELKIKESELIVQRQEWNDREKLYLETKTNFDALNAQHKEVIEELKMLHEKVTCLEDERKLNEKTMSEYKEIMQRQKGENKELQAKENELTVLQDDFNRAQDMIKTLDRDISDLMVTNKDLVSDMEGCRRRESELLDLTEKLSRKNAKLQSDNTNLNNQVISLMSEAENKNKKIQELEAKVQDLVETLASVKKSLQEEVDSLKAELGSKTKDVEKYKQCFEDEKDVVRTLKKRHVNNVKDLTRQLQQARKRLEALENHTEKDAVSMGSRTSSNGSLNTVDRENSAHTSSNHSSAANSRAPSQEQEYPVITEQVEVDKHVLIERIVRLQRAHARKNEKLEFLEDHIQQLLVEIQKKTKIIHNYFMREEAGTLSPDYMDENKALLAKKGGIMASVYSTQQQDGHLTLDLSLEINKKLQGVLEDTILKNITLKDNIDTLGAEISRLSQENRQLQLRLQGIKT